MTGNANGHPRDRLSEYLDDALEVDVRQSVDRHLAGCEDCRAELAALRRLASAVAQEDVPPVPAELAARVGRRLDQATLARPRFRRFVVPASIAATLGAVGLLVMLQWRQGRLGVPATTDVSQPEERAEAFKERKSEDLPSTPAAADEKTSAQSEPAAGPDVAPEVQHAPLDRLDNDVKRNEQPERERDLKAKKAEAAQERVVVGGVAGGVAGGDAAGLAAAPEGNGAAAPSGGLRDAPERASRQRAAADDARRDTGASKVQEQTAPAPSKPSSSFAPAPPSKTDGAGSCAERWSDSGVRGSWSVPDIDAAERQLGRVAHAVGGIGLWRGVADGRPYIVVVPRAHFEEVFYALRARGVAGLQDPPALPEGSDCTGIFVALILEPPAPDR